METHTETRNYALNPRFPQGGLQDSLFWTVRASRNSDPREWVELSFRCQPPPSTVRVSIATVLNDQKSHFYAKLPVSASGHVRRLLKCGGTPSELSLKFDVPTEPVRVALKSVNRKTGAAGILARGLVHTLVHPTLLVQRARKLVMAARGRGLPGMGRFLREEFLIPAVCYNQVYDQWSEHHLSISQDDRRTMERQGAAFDYRPTLSILLPVFNPPARWLEKAIQSVVAQTYPHWELCIADDASTDPAVREVLAKWAATDARIRVLFREKNGHISEASNSALSLASGEFTGLLDHDDELSEDALFWVVEALNRNRAADLLYSDEDKIDEHGQVFDPHFKTEWNIDLLYSLNFVSHFAVYRTQLLRELGGFRIGFEGSQDYDLVLRVSERTTDDRICHIPRILYHWRALETSTALRPEAKSYAAAASRRAIAEHFQRRGIAAEVVPGFGHFNRVRYPLPAPAPRVSLIIGTRDKVQLLRGIVRGVLERTKYPNVELIVVDNQSEQLQTKQYLTHLSRDPRVKILRFDQPFNFSRMNNLGAEIATGSYIGFLNNDLRVIHPEWLNEMMSLLVQPEVGVVGAKLYFPDDTIQHAGVILGIGGVAGHVHKYLPRSHAGYMSKVFLVQNYSAVTGACLLTKKSIFSALGGFDAENLPIAFNDVNYCLQVRELGYRVVWTPYAELYHLESASRGSDNTPENSVRYQREANFMKEKWKDAIEHDPFYNPNLTLATEDFSYAFPSRVKSPSELFGGGELLS